jgi:glycosyltransferase involved in cell wall biosynthesis
VAVVSRAVYPLHGYGGLERHVCDLVHHLSQRGLVVTLITRPATGPPNGVGAAEGATVRFVPYRTFPFAGRRGTTVLDRSTAYPLFGLRAGRLAAALVRAGLVDVVHGLGASVLGYAMAPAEVRGRAPLVFNPQGLEEFGGTGQRFAGGRLKRLAYTPLRWAVRRCAAASAAVLATDHAIAPSVCRYLPAAADRVVVIPNAVDVEACDQLAGPADGAELRRHLPDAAIPLLLSVGRIERNKGFHVLVDALSRLRDRRWRWVVVGDGPFRNALESAIAERGLSGRVLLASRVQPERLHAWYEAADLFVHPTLYEGSSLVTLEAMAHGRAVVATTAGGLPDKVRPDETGWLVPPGDADALARAVGTALDHRDRLQDLGEAGRALVERTFSWRAVADQTIALYTRLVNR